MNKLFKAALEGTTQQATTTVTITKEVTREAGIATTTVTKTLTETQTISSIDTTTITETLKAGTNGVIVAGVAIIAVIIGMIVSFILYKRI